MISVTPGVLTKDCWRSPYQRTSWGFMATRRTVCATSQWGWNELCRSPSLPRGICRKWYRVGTSAQAEKRTATNGI